jgi:hypothetical protein
MAAVQSKIQRSAAPERPALTIADMVLVRIAAGAATRADLQRDLAAFFAPRVSGTAFRQGAELAIGNFSAQGLISDVKGKLTVTSGGLRSAEGLIAPIQVAKTTWETLRNHALLMRALGLAHSNAALAKAIERTDGLAALVLQQHYGIPLSRAMSHNDLRAELAVIALERAFGNKIKTGLGKGSGLAGSTARLLAGQLFAKPREFSSDGKLVRALAAEVAGAANDTDDALRLAVLRRLTGLAELDGEDDADETSQPISRAPKAANDASPLSSSPPKMAAPSMSEFANAVIDAARPISEGWPGNRKAFISRVWQTIRVARRDWELTEIAFKSMLAEAHRSGQLVLATADLKDKTSLRDLEDSKILYKNTVWHFVRVED